MTLGDGKRKVLMLLDEYSTAGALTEDEDIDAKMNDFFDVAQKDVAQRQPILRRAALELDGTGEQSLPEDVMRALKLTRDGKRARGFEVLDGKLLYPAGETGGVTLDYVARPATITRDTEDSHVFEVSEEACACLPFFVAAQQLLPDLVVDYGSFYNIYLQMRGALQQDTALTGGGLRQALYR